MQLANSEEYIDGALAGHLGEILIRCNNVLYIRGKTFFHFWFCIFGLFCGFKKRLFVYEFHNTNRVKVLFSLVSMKSVKSDCHQLSKI